MTLNIPPLGRVYDATMHRLVDADTEDVIPSRPQRLRYLGINSAELRSSDPVERAIAREQLAWMQGWFSARDFSRFRTDGRLDDAFGRELAWRIYKGDPAIPPSLYQDDFLERWGDAYIYGAATKLDVSSFASRDGALEAGASLMIAEALARKDFPFTDTVIDKEDGKKPKYVARDENDEKKKVVKAYDGELIERLAKKPK